MGSSVHVAHLEAGLPAASGVASCQWPPAAAAAASCHWPSLQCPGGACIPITKGHIDPEHRIPASADAGPTLASQHAGVSNDQLGCVYLTE